MDQLQVQYCLMRFSQSCKCWWAIWLWGFEVSFVNSLIMYLWYHKQIGLEPKHNHYSCVEQCAKAYIDPINHWPKETVFTYNILSRRESDRVKKWRIGRGALPSLINWLTLLQVHSAVVVFCHWIIFQIHSRTIIIQSSANFIRGHSNLYQEEIMNSTYQRVSAPVLAVVPFAMFTSVRIALTFSTRMIICHRKLVKSLTNKFSFHMKLLKSSFNIYFN